MGEVIAENDLARHIRYRHHISHASWDSQTKLWTLEVLDKTTGLPRRFTGKFLYMCQGYYRHGQGYMPEWPNMAAYQGRLVHSEEWPEGLDYADKRVLVIGSGASAATIIPAMAAKAAHVVMLQRSPTYFRVGRNAIEIAEELRTLGISEDWIHEITRRKILFEQAKFAKQTFTQPEKVKEALLDGIRNIVGPDYDIATHFTPRYRPWRQRMAFVPNGDLFHGIASGKASVVTDEIERFSEKGVVTKSGQELEADIIVAATGFNLNVLGDIAFEIDGKPLDFHETVTYRGMMFTGVPNMLWIFGYFRASWTLRADLLGDFVCRLLHHMDDIGARKVTPQLRPEDADMELGSWIDPENFNPGYLTRGLHLLPQQGDLEPWTHKQDYWVEKDELPAADLDDGTLVYTR